MSTRFSATIALYLLFLASWSALNAFLDRRGTAAWRAGLAIVWIALLVQPVAAAITLAGGRRLTEPATFWGYLAVSALLLPLAAARLEKASARAAGASMALVLIALCVVVWRLEVIWEAG